ncbi:hypothetical protein RhiJN_07972 [Ceratobasidium sp. AG-Ba]|nr:hypothetical protein RhiJN_07972 [Ceratobasidium sp. AG-Ba]
MRLIPVTLIANTPVQAEHVDCDCPHSIAGVFDFSLAQFVPSRYLQYIVRLPTSARIQRFLLCWNSTGLPFAIPVLAAFMPAADPGNQQAARSIEKSLRDAVFRQERPPIELTWFEALPKRVRRSAALIEAAQADSQVLLEHVQAEWSKTRQSELEREERLKKARAQPRDFEVLRAPDPTAWQGLGRRKKRCRAFESVGRAYNTRQRLPGSGSTSNTQPTDMFLLHPSSCYVPKRSPTPPGLRDAIRNVPGLIHAAIGPANISKTSFFPVV